MDAASASRNPLYNYTSGRFLWGESRQLEERSTEFNLVQLQLAAAQCVGSDYCSSVKKVSEGRFSKKYQMITNYGVSVIAKIPNYNTGQPMLSVASEVATMEFAREVLKLPVPRVYASNVDAANPVGVQYLIMEHFEGLPLHEAWDDMTVAERNILVKDIVMVEKRLLAVSFTRYRSIYYAKHSIPGCEKIEVLGTMSDNTREYAETQFVIGPVTCEDFYHEGRGEDVQDCGPWYQPQDFIKDICRREQASLNKGITPQRCDGLFQPSKSQKSATAHLKLYRKLSHMADIMLPENRQLVRPTLWAWKHHAPNVIVHKGQLRAIVDWQETWAGPLFFQACHPRLMGHHNIMLRLRKRLPSTTGADEDKAGIRRTMLLFTYENLTMTFNPVLDKLFNLPLWGIQRDMMELARIPWDHSIHQFRDHVIQIWRHWEEINPRLDCPITFSEADLHDHFTEEALWTQEEVFWKALVGSINRADGWVSHEDYPWAIKDAGEIRRVHAMIEMADA